MDETLHQWLSDAGLSRYYRRFASNGVTSDNFLDLNLKQYEEYGIKNHADQQRLLKLANGLRREHPDYQHQYQQQLQQQQQQAQQARNRRRSLLNPLPYEDDDFVDSPYAPDPSSDEEDLQPGEWSESWTLLDDFDATIPTSKIMVCVRKRPMSRSERETDNDIATVRPSKQTIIIHEPKIKVDLTEYVDDHSFIFDEVFTVQSTNDDIYRRVCRPLVSFFLAGGKSTCFAYGQTGSGKTFTMMGPRGGSGVQAGLYVKAADDIFNIVGKHPNALRMSVWASYYEIYGGKLFDLLNNRKKLVCREDGSGSVNIVGLQQRQCHSSEELLGVVGAGNTLRSTGSTGANADSSRSHAILQIELKVPVRSNDGKRILKPHGKFSFIDLAGSERGADTTHNSRQTRLEGAEINKSLLALKECIRALDQKAVHRPFRGSKLTQVLKDSLVGNCRTVMIANISPNSSSCEHTLNTLRYADRVKEMKKSNSSSKSGEAYMPHLRVNNKENHNEIGNRERSLHVEENYREPPRRAPSNRRRSVGGIPSAPPSTRQTRQSVGTSNVSRTKSRTRRRMSEADSLPPKHSSSSSSSGSSGGMPPKPNSRPRSRAAAESVLPRPRGPQSRTGGRPSREALELVEAHRAYIDRNIACLRLQMQLLSSFEQNPSLSMEEYSDTLLRILDEQMYENQSLGDHAQDVFAGMDHQNHR